jgi:Tol biopolymer transport system component
VKALLIIPLVLASAVALGAAESLGTRGGDTSQPSWLVLSSTRDGDEYTAGEGSGYLMRPDGSRLTRLLDAESPLAPVGTSDDGHVISFESVELSAVYVARADGTKVKRVFRRAAGEIQDVSLSPNGGEVAITIGDRQDHRHLLVVSADGRHLRRLGRASFPDWSPDGHMLVFSTLKGCGLAVAPFDSVKARIRGLCGSPEFSPDARSVVFPTKGGCVVAETPSTSPFAPLVRAARDDRRVLLRGDCKAPEWSPDGRWIAFEWPACTYCDSAKDREFAQRHRGVWLVRPDGSGRRRVGPVDDESDASYSWSPDGKRLAITAGPKIVVVGPPGRALRVRGLSAASDSGAPPLWSPDARRLIVAARTGEDPAQLWSLRPDGTGLRRLTSAGVNDVVGIAHLAKPTRPPAHPPEASEWSPAPRTLATMRPIARLSADEGRVAYVPGSIEGDCEHVSVWRPASDSIRRVWPRLPAPCDDDYGVGSSFYELALAGSVAGWSVNLGCGNSGCGVETHTAVLPKADPKLVDWNDGEDYGNEFLYPFDPVGRGKVFVVESNVRVALPGGKVRRCKLPGDAEAVDGRLIAVRTSKKITIVNDRCAVVSTISLYGANRDTVLLEDGRLVVARPRLADVYDAATGALVLQRALPAGYAVDGAAGGVLVLRRGTMVVALRLQDGRSTSFRPCRGPISTAIDRTGLYYSYTTVQRQGRLVFVPRAELERRLASGIAYEPRCLRSADTFATAFGPAAVTAADLNGDGQTDLVTADGAFGGVTVLLHDRRGFDPRRDYRTGGEVYDVAAADFDGDGDQDLVAAVVDRRAVAVLFNKGDGSFAPPRRYRVGKSPDDIAVGDLDSDGAPDLAVENHESASVSILLNRGDGTFAPRVDRPAGEQPSSVAIGDVSGDGKPDLVFGHNLAPTLTLLYGAGHGSFGRVRRVKVEEESNAVAVADLNGDGHQDVAVIRGCTISYLPGRSGGRFGPEREVAEAEGNDCPSELAAADLDGDRWPDLASTAGPYGFPSTVSVYLNGGHGRFGTPRSYETGANNVDSAGLAVDDLNGDGRPDLAVTNYDNGFVAVLTNTLGVCHVHRFRGKTPAAAATGLARVHCRVGGVRRAFSKRVPKGRVLSAEPRFGAFWPGGAVVDLVVSRGRR